MLLSNIIYAQCYQDRHSTIADDAWISCEMSVNPNVVRGESYWIMYDLGEVNNLGQSHFWNINANDRTNEGISLAVVDYSFDGINWTEWGSFSLNQADGSTIYEGEQGPDFNALHTRYLLITILENHGGDCVGISEVKIETSELVSSTEDLTILGVTELTASPNPADDQSTLMISSTKKIDAIMTVLDITGKIVTKEEINIRNGNNEYPIATSGLSSGQYIVNVESQNNSAFVKLSIIHSN